ncbi:GspH/FimT family pseudopilin [Pseudomonas capeferrum]|uniref:GspH/FimT family pseudopilin n=1 Tax=Pseudomonas capeferrum TaxID=1495066 RepID=UPI001C61561C
MMFALALGALLTQVGIPSYISISRELEHTAAARNFAQALRSARSLALLHNQPVLVQPLQDDWGIGWRMMLERDRQLLREKRYPRPLRTTGNFPRDQGVRFNALGVPVRAVGGFSGATLNICPYAKGGTRHQVVLSPSGRVRLSQEVTEETSCAGV